MQVQSKITNTNIFKKVILDIKKQEDLSKRIKVFQVKVWVAKINTIKNIVKNGYDDTISYLRIMTYANVQNLMTSLNIVAMQLRMVIKNSFF